MLTHGSLIAWIHEADDLDCDHADRLRVARLILAACKTPSNATEDEMLVVLGPLTLADYPALRSLPPGLQVAGNLTVSDCPKLAVLPDNLVVKGDLEISNCAGITHIPQPLWLGGSLFVSRCDALTHLPAKLTVLQNLMVERCPKLEALPERLVVSCDLSVTHCPALTLLPQKLAVGGAIELSGCPGIAALPSGWVVKGDLTLVGCTRLATLPQGLQVLGSLNLRGCTQLVSLGAQLRVRDGLIVDGCSNLRLLSANLRLAHTLSAVGCVALTGLPRGLQVGADANFSQCLTLRDLPDDLIVGGNLHVVDCMLVTRVPARAVGWPRRAGLSHSVYGSGSGLFASALDPNAGAVPDGIYLDLSQDITAEAPQFDDLNDALEHFARLGVQHAQPAQTAALQARLTHDQTHVLRRYLGRLVRTADYMGAGTQDHLLARLNVMLSRMGADPSFGAYALGLMEGAQETCDDRVIHGLDAIELAWDLRRIEGLPEVEARAALQDLGLGHFALSIVHAHAARACATIFLADEVEVYLEFEITLRDRLGLPGGTTSKIFDSFVPPAAIEAAAQDALARTADAAAVAAYLAAWSPWQRLQRQSAAAKLPYAALPRRALADGPPADLICPFTQEAAELLVEPVYLGPTTRPRVYEWRSLQRWWLEHGTDPSNQQPFDLADLYRAAP